MNQHEGLKPGQNYVLGGRPAQRTLVFTRDDLTRASKDKPAEGVGFSDIEGLGYSDPAQAADRIEFHDGGRVFLLKNRNGPTGEVIPPK